MSLSLFALRYLPPPDFLQPYVTNVFIVVVVFVAAADDDVDVAV